MCDARRAWSPGDRSSEPFAPLSYSGRPIYIRPPHADVQSWNYLGKRVVIPLSLFSPLQFPSTRETSHGPLAGYGSGAQSTQGLKHLGWRRETTDDEGLHQHTLLSEGYLGCYLRTQAPVRAVLGFTSRYSEDEDGRTCVVYSPGGVFSTGPTQMGVDARAHRSCLVPHQISSRGLAGGGIFDREITCILGVHGDARS